jgi:hypothetical protein
VPAALAPRVRARVGAPHWQVLSHGPARQVGRAPGVKLTGEAAQEGSAHGLPQQDPEPQTPGLPLPLSRCTALQAHLRHLPAAPASCLDGSAASAGPALMFHPSTALISRSPICVSRGLDLIKSASHTLLVHVCRCYSDTALRLFSSRGARWLALLSCNALTQVLEVCRRGWSVNCVARPLAASCALAPPLRRRRSSMHRPRRSPAAGASSSFLPVRAGPGAVIWADSRTPTDEERAA